MISAMGVLRKDTLVLVKTMRLVCLGIFLQVVLTSLLVVCSGT